MNAVEEFHGLLSREGTSVVFHRESEASPNPCPCRTPEGFRDPEWHAAIEALALPPGPVIVNDNGPGLVTGMVKYATAYRYNFPATYGQFDKLRVATMGFSVADRQIEIIIPEFHEADVAATGVTHLVLFRSVNDGPWNQIGIWQDLAAPVIDNNLAGFVGTGNIPVPPECNEAAMVVTLADVIHRTVKGFVQPIQSTRATRLQDERLPIPRGEVQADDHLGIFPVVWEGQRLDFYPWPEAGQDYVEYNGRRFHVVNANMLPGPGGVIEHHWEVALRLRSSIG